MAQQHLVYNTINWEKINRAYFFPNHQYFEYTFEAGYFYCVADGRSGVQGWDGIFRLDTAPSLVQKKVLESCWNNPNRILLLGKVRCTSADYRTVLYLESFIDKTCPLKRCYKAQNNTVKKKYYKEKPDVNNKCY